MKQRKLFAYLNIATLILLLLAIYYSYASGGFMYTLFSNDTDGFLSFFESKSDVYQILTIVILVIVEVIIGIIPGPLIYPLIGLLINPLLGSGLILLGNILGSVINFYQGRILWSGFSDKSVESKSRFVNKLESGGAWTLFFLRLNPLTSFDFLPYIAGGSGMKFRNFFIANTLGLIPLILIGTYLGGEILNEYAWALKLLLALTLVWIVFEFLKSQKKRNWVHKLVRRLK